MESRKLKSLLISKNTNITQAMQKLDQTAENILFVVNENCKLLATLVDGDIRRGIIRGLKLTHTIERVMKTDFISINESNPNKHKLAVEYMRKKMINRIPVISENGVIKDVISWTDYLSHISVSEPNFAGNELKYIKECIDTKWVSSVGKYVDLFEECIANFTGSKYAVACVNGTAALQVSLRLVGVVPGDEVILPTLTFIAPVNAVRYLNADPVFMDADEYYNLDVEKTIQFLKEETKFEKGFTINKATNKRITAIIPVHVFGNAVDLEPLLEICADRNIFVVEDAAESIGTSYTKDRLAGKHTGTIGSVGCFSFNGNKIITTGGGGMILTDDVVMAEKARYLTTQARDSPVYYIHDEVGYNFRLTNIQAAMGVAQLEQLPKFLQRKKEIYHTYKEKAELIAGLHIADVPEYADNNRWMIPLQIDKIVYGKDREELMAHLADNKIETRPVWWLNHKQKPYKCCRSYQIEKAEDLLANTLNIPSSVNITEDQINSVIEALSNA